MKFDFYFVYSIYFIFSKKKRENGVKGSENSANKSSFKCKAMSDLGEHDPHRSRDSHKANGETYTARSRAETNVTRITHKCELVAAKGTRGALAPAPLLFRNRRAVLDIYIHIIICTSTHIYYK